MFESLRNITNSTEREALVSIVETRTTDYFPDTSGKHPAQEHFAQYSTMVEENYKTLKSYTDQYGWPSQDKLTKIGLSQKDALAVETAAFLCVQHLDANITPRIKAENYDITGQDIASTWQDKLSDSRVVGRQSEMLSLMKEDGANGGFCCYLTDRTLRNSDQPQLFGTQGSLSSFGIGDEKPPQISLPSGDIVSIDVAISNSGFLARRNSSGLSQDMESLQTHNPLSFVKEARNHFPLHANDTKSLDILKQEIASVRDLSQNGLDPNSPLIKEYINSSYSKDGWANIHKEIGGFTEVTKDGNRSEGERIDAEGYYAICKFKITGHLNKLNETDREQEIKKLAPVLEEHFGLSGNVTFKQIQDHTESYAREVAEKYTENFTTPAKASALCQASAVIMQMPSVGGKCEDFDQVAQQHFKAANQCADMGSSRGCTYLSTAYEWMQDPHIPYKEAVEHLVEKPSDMDFNKFCKGKDTEYTEKAAELGSLSAVGSLGKAAKKEGNLEQAEPQLKIAADGGFNRYQYLLGELYLSQGKNEGAKHYLAQARENGFDVEKELKKSGLTLPEEKKQHTPEHKALGEQLSRSGVSMGETEPHYRRPTTNSLLKEGKLEEAMDHDPKFADMVREQQGKGKGDGFSR